MQAAALLREAGLSSGRSGTALPRPAASYVLALPQPSVSGYVSCLCLTVSLPPHLRRVCRNRPDHPRPNNPRPRSSSTASVSGHSPIIGTGQPVGKTSLPNPASVVITARKSPIGLLVNGGVLKSKAALPCAAQQQSALRNSDARIRQAQRRVLVLVNGERLNNPDMSSPSLLRVPMTSISRIEIVRGPQTVLHGDFASAGVINIITDDATAEQQTTLGASVGAYDTYSAFVNTTGMFGEDGVSYRASADWEKSDGYRDNSDYETYQLNAALRKDFGENRFLSLSTFYHDAEYGLPGALSRERYHNAPRSSTTPRDRSELESYGIRLGGRTTVGADGMFDLNATASRRETDSRWLSAPVSPSTAARSIRTRCSRSTHTTYALPVTARSSRSAPTCGMI